MQTDLAPWMRNMPEGAHAEEILRRCVHCGFCLATCPTYQELGDELDSPRGRIYLIKQMLEGNEVSATTQQHLDQCLTCRGCETTCPSGVEFGRLIDIGRSVAAQRVSRKPVQRVQRALLRHGLNSPLIGPVVALSRMFRRFLPAVLRNQLSVWRGTRRLPSTRGSHQRRVILLQGCVQPALIPSIDQATIRVLDAVGIGAQTVPGAVCCGAINFHLDAQDKARKQMRRNIDAWWPALGSGAFECIVSNASGCGAMLREYARHLHDEPDYAEKAVTLSRAVRDISEVLSPHAGLLKSKMAKVNGQPYVFHPPCSLQHWQRLAGVTESLLHDLGIELRPLEESHLCCGAAGTYSLTQPALSRRLRDRKLAHVAAVTPSGIISSNIGCITHLQGGTDLPVFHWVEVIDERLRARTPVQ